MAAVMLLSAFSCSSAEGGQETGILREIRERAYAGTEFGSIVVPEGVESVGPYAFADCAELTKVIVLSADTDFAGSAFEGCAGLTFLAPAGSTAQAFAGAHGYSFEAYVP